MVPLTLLRFRFALALGALLLCAYNPRAMYAQESPVPSEELSPRQQRKAERKARRLEQRFLKDRYIVSEYGLMFNQTQDTRMEQSIFRGPGAHLHLGYYSQTSKGLHDYDIGAGQFSYLFADHEGSEVLATRVDANYTYLHRLRAREGSSWGWQLGGAANLIWHFRYNETLVNSASNWDGIGALAVASEWSRNIRWGQRPTWIHYRAMLPLAAYVLRTPEFGLSFTQNQQYFAPIGKFTRLYSEIGITRSLGRQSDNLIRLVYAWDFYALNDSDIHKVRVANHNLIFSFFLKM